MSCKPYKCEPESAQHSSDLIDTIPSVEPKLAGAKNYARWKHNMKMTLMTFDLWDCMKSSKPTELDQRKAQKALVCICLNIEEHCLAHVKNVATAIQAWTALESVYADPCRISSCVRSMQSLFEARSTSNVQMYISEALALSQELRELGLPIADEVLGIIILSAVPLNLAAQYYQCTPIPCELLASQRVISDLLRSNYSKK